MEVPGARCWALVLAAAWCAAPSAADDTSESTSPLATLPQSNEALVLSSHVEQAIQIGDYRNAIELIERIRSLPDALVAAPASRTYYPVWRQTFFLQGLLPPEGIELYRQLHDAAVASRADEAARAADLETLRDLFRAHRLSTHWARIGGDLASQLLDRGEYGEAIEVLRELEWAGAAGASSRRMQLVVALEQVGAGRAARDILAGLVDAGKDPADVQRLDLLSDWMHRNERGTLAAAGPETYRVAPGMHWSMMFSTALDDGRDRAESLIAAMDAHHRVPLFEPAARGEALVFRADGRVHVVNTLALTERWSATEIPPTGATAGFSAWREGEDDGEMSADARLFLTHHLRHTLAIDERRVYTIEALVLEAPSVEPLGQQAFSVERQLAQRNELVARDLQTGRMEWRSGQEPSGPLFDVEFQDRPVTGDGKLFVPYRRGDDLLIGELDAGSGALVREQKIVGPPTHFTRQGGRCLLTGDETTLYLGTGNGVVAALRREGLDWRWATVYPSTVAEYLGRLWWKPPVRPRESGVDRPVLADDLIVWGPTDSMDLFALDRFSGRERWRMARRDYAYIVGAVAGGLIVGGNGLTCLELDDPAGRPPRWRSTPLEIVGRPVLRDTLLFIPTRGGLVVLDGVTGKIVRDEWAPASGEDARTSSAPNAAYGGFAEPAGVAITPEAVFLVSPLRITKYPAPAVTRERCEVAAAQAGAGAEVLLARAWLDALAGAHETALEQLTALEASNANVARARDHLLTQVYLALAGGVATSDERLGWLRRALALAHSPGLTAQLQEEIADVLTQSSDWAALLEHLGTMLRRREPSYAAAGDGGERAGWLSAVRRLRTLAGGADAQIPDGLLAAFVEQLIDDPKIDPILLMRTALALGDTPPGRRVALHLLSSGLPPEIRVRYIPTAMRAADATAEQRRDRLLDRWEVLVALDRLEEADAARDAWRSASAAAVLSDAERDRAVAIDIAHKKLELGRGAPLGEQLWRQWRARNTELIVDPHRLGDATRRWQLVRDQENREIQLIDVFRHEYARRKTPDTLSNSSGGRNAGAAFAENMLIGRLRRDVGGVRRQYWPAARYGALAAIPTDGGLIGFGMGPERSGGKRLWELPVADWDTFPDEFGALSAAGPYGVYFMPRSDRIALVGWADGEVWWRVRFDGATIERLLLAGDALLVVSSDRRAWLLDALTGGAPRPLDLDTASALGLTTVDDVVVAWSGSFVAAFDPSTGKRLWVLPASGLSQRFATVTGRPWLLLGSAGSANWRAVDVRGGAFVSPAPDAFGPFNQITAAAVVGERWFVAGTIDGANDEEQSLHAYDLRSGARLWSAEVPSRVPINASQLRAHAEFIPVLLHHEEQDADGERFEAAPAIQLIRKRDGEGLAPRSLTGDYQSGPAACDMVLLATETRIIVQVEGNLVAYGQSALSQP